jgi:hypothetical protein
MKLLKKFTLIGLFAAAVALMPTRAYADLFLTLNDGTNAWTFQTQTGCSTCTEILSVTIPAGSNYIGNFLADFQWTIDGTNPTGISPNPTSTNAGATTDWTLSANNLSNGGCSGGDPHAVCGDFGASGAATGFGPLTATTLNWHFTTTFSSNIGTPTVGNIRGLIIPPAGSNGNVSLFSPGGGDFTGGTGGGGGGGGGGGTGSTIPEPASLLLFGLGATAVAYRARRRLTGR